MINVTQRFGFLKTLNYDIYHLLPHNSEGTVIDYQIPSPLLNCRSSEVSEGRNNWSIFFHNSANIFVLLLDLIHSPICEIETAKNANTSLSKSIYFTSERVLIDIDWLNSIDWYNWYCSLQLMNVKEVEEHRRHSRKEEKGNTRSAAPPSAKKWKGWEKKLQEKLLFLQSAKENRKWVLFY